MWRLIQEPYIRRPLAAISILMALYVMNDRVFTHYGYSRETRMRMAVVGTLGGPCIPVIAQCCTSRNLTEGIYSRRSELPGGYCSHSDCDVVFTGDISFEEHYTLHVIRQGKRP